jgi:hypothetical protein
MQISVAVMDPIFGVWTRYVFIMLYTKLQF